MGQRKLVTFLGRRLTVLHLISTLLMQLIGATEVKKATDMSSS